MARSRTQLVGSALFLIFFLLYRVDAHNRVLKYTKNIPPGTKAFKVIWNCPTHECEQGWGIDLDVEKYGMVQNGGDEWRGREISLFYSAEFGLWPHYDSNKQAVNGGLPQLGNLSAHLEKVHRDIQKYIPESSFKGLGVIDWESWRPVWERDRDSQLIYQQESETLVRSNHPSWPPTRVTEQAKIEFETAARAYMEGTLMLVSQLRPGGQWGFYGFPRCYNYGDQWVCSEKTMALNDRLDWMFKASSAIYPSAYLNARMKNASAYAHGQILEARRVRGELKTPIYLYSTFMQNTELFYTKALLDDSILQAANMGTDGVVLWSSSAESESKESCQQIKTYLDSKLGPYVNNIINKTLQCSETLCGNRGRCVHVETLEEIEVLVSGGHMCGIVRTIFTAWKSFRSWLYEKLMLLFLRQDTTSMCDCLPGWTGKRCDNAV